MNKLVIVESPNKINAIQKYLGDEYEVMASVGHIFKLSTRSNSTKDIKFGIHLDTWEPIYILDPSKKNVVSQLKKAVKNASEVLIATDPDREGEAIGENLVTELKIEDKYYRIKYNEITKEAILRAIDNKGKIDNHLVSAQKARRMLDRLIGFDLSNLMRKKIKNSATTLSAGRVQSIALKLIVDREKEIEAFIPVQYSKLHALVNKDNKSIELYLNIESNNANEKTWINSEQIESIKKELEIQPQKELIVTDIKSSQRKMASITPLKQAMLYRKSPYTSLATQMAAQKLYEGYGDGGLISYPRTDSTRLSQTFIDNARKYIEKTYGKEYILENIKGFSGDQDAHEAIRPTDMSLTPELAKVKFNLNDYDFNVYKLIYNHTLQALMNPPIRKSNAYTLNKNDLVFKYSASKIIFDGYYKVVAPEEEKFDPEFKLGEKVLVNDYIFTEHQTEPPARYSEGALIEKLDEIKVGRPSTFASTVKILLDRQYAENINKSLHPTEIGKLVLEKLLEAFPTIIDEGYTAKVEEELDLIAENKLTLQPVMEDFYERFTQVYDNAENTLEITKIEPKLLDENCPEDGGQLLIRSGKFGQFIGCSNFPNCRYTRDYGEKKKFNFRKFGANSNK